MKNSERLDAIEIKFEEMMREIKVMSFQIKKMLEKNEKGKNESQT